MALQASGNGIANGGDAIGIDNDDMDDVEIIGDTNNERKRKMENAPNDEMSMLKAKLRHLEDKNSELKAERDFFQTKVLALEPNTTPSLIHEHEFEMEFLTDLDGSKRSDAFTVDGVEFVVRVGYESSTRGGGTRSYFGGRSSDLRCRVTPYIKSADDSSRYVLMLCTVTQRQRFGRSAAQCSFEVAKFLEGGFLYKGKDETFVATAELAKSKIKVRYTIVVQKMESPLNGIDFDATTIDVHGEEFRVSASYLSQWSMYFRAYFSADMAEKKRGVFPVKDTDISADDFREMVHVIAPTAKEITEQNYEMLLRLASRFEMPALRRRVELFLIDFARHRLPKAKLFRMAADQHGLQFVQAHLLHRWCEPELLRSELLTSHHYKRLQPATQNHINAHLAEAAIYTYGLRGANGGCGHHHTCTSDGTEQQRRQMGPFGSQGQRGSNNHNDFDDGVFARSPDSSDDEEEEAEEAEQPEEEEDD